MAAGNAWSYENDLGWSICPIFPIQMKQILSFYLLCTYKQVMGKAKKNTMKDNSEIIIRTVQVSDVEKLKNFFIKAYGEKTIFQNEQFLTHYLDAGLNAKSVSVIA